jgi:hypothetical protein
VIEKEILGMVISEVIFRLTGFGPSRSICDVFAGQVIAEANAMHQDLSFHEQ